MTNGEVDELHSTRSVHDTPDRCRDSGFVVSVCYAVRFPIAPFPGRFELVLLGDGESAEVAHHQHQGLLYPHLLETGARLNALQTYLGRSSPWTAMFYLALFVPRQSPPCMSHNAMAVPAVKVP